MYQGEKAFLQKNKENPKEVNEVEFEELFQKKERDFYAGIIRYDGMIDFLESHQIEAEVTEKRRNMLLNLFKGMGEQEKVNVNAVRFNLSTTAEVGKKDVEGGNLSPREVQKAFLAYEKKDELKSEEQAAIKFYETALNCWEDTTYVDRQKVELLICDIKYRIAKRITEENKREAEMAKVKAERVDIADDIVNKGLRAEVQFVQLVNDWAEKQGKGHLIEAYSSLPLDDHKEKVDTEIAIGGKIFNINLKSYNFSTGVNSFNEKLIEKEKNKIANSKIEIVIVDSSEIQKVWRLMKEKDPTISEKREITRLTKSVIGRVQEGALLNELSVDKKLEKVREFPSKKQIIERHSNVPNLVKWGYLLKDEAINVESIMRAKKNLREDLEDKEKFKELRAAI